MLPFFTTHPVYTVQMYSFLTSAHTLGRITGALFHYRVPFPPGKKFAIALGVYITISVLQGPLLYMPYPMMLVSMFFYGVLGVTSFNIRTSGTQSYVPSHLRGRFNSLFTMITTCGTLVGQLIAGALGESFSIPMILLLPRIFALNGILAAQAAADVLAFAVSIPIQIPVLRELDRMIGKQ